MRKWKSTYWFLIVLMSCDSSTGIDQIDEELPPVRLSAYDEISFSSGRQNIKVRSSGQLADGRWEAGSDSPGLWAGTFTRGELWLAGIQDGVVRANMTTRLGNNLVFSPIVPSRQDGSIFSIRKADLQSSFSNWPSELGAPTDEQGRPIIYGDVMTWSTLVSIERGDTNGRWPSAHGFDSLRVSQAVFGLDDPTFEDVYFVRYEISNASDVDINDMYIGFQTATILTIKGPDRGCSTSRTGFDYLRKISYTYVTGDELPSFCYGTVAGFTFADVNLGTGEKIETGSHRKLRKNASNEPGFGENDLHRSEHVFRALQGLSAEVQPMTDPTTGAETKWAFSVIPCLVPDGLMTG